MTHEENVTRWLPPGTGLVGVEIGPGSSPVPGLDPAPFYVDCFKAFGAVPAFADYYGHATLLPFHDHSLDYVIASHVLEHVANPVAALLEWHRALRPGGIVYLVVPDRRATWDRTRSLTPVAHLLEDFAHGVTACDATHIDEFAARVADDFFGPDIAAADLPARRTLYATGLHQTVERGDDINIHFHTFEPSTLRELFLTLAARPSSSSSPHLDWEILDLRDTFPASCPNGILAVLRVRKGWLAHAQAASFRLHSQGDRRAALRPDAEPFATWAARTPGLGGVR